MLHLDRRHAGEFGADIDRPGEIIMGLPVDDMGFGQADLASFSERVFNRGKKILVLIETLRPTGQQVHLVVFLVGYHEYCRVYVGQQATYGFQPFFRKTAMHCNPGLAVLREESDAAPADKFLATKSAR